MISAVSGFSSFSIPLMEPRVAKKVAALALVSFAYLGLNFAGFASALILGGSTWICERTVREEKTDWFSGKSFEITSFGSSFLSIFFQRAVVAISCLAICLLRNSSLPAGNPQVALEAVRMKSPLSFIFIAVIIAPIVEEILFRGFLQERLEDLSRLVLFPFAKKTREKVCNIAQAIFFGFAHIIGGQVSEAGKWLVMASTTYLGYAFGKLKLENKSLVVPMMMHAGFNGVSVALS